MTAQQAQSQRAKFGANEFYKAKPISIWAIAREEVTEPMMVLLIIAGVVYSFFGKLRDAGSPSPTPGCSGGNAARSSRACAKLACAP